ncbi:MAG: protein kinase [Capsulimonadales bacterium]|nr:protein kinase [Capsulimonadales bacterium]
MRCLNCHTDGVAVNAVTCPGCGVHLPSAHRDLLPPGTELHGGKYVIEYALGQGGFGITYRSIQVALNRRVAIKEFFPRDQVGRNTAQGHSLIVGVSQQERFQRSLQRFQQEALTLAALHHPNVVSVLDIFEERSTAYIVMEYLSGKTLRDEMDAVPGRRLPEDRVRKIIGVLVDALRAVHSKSVFHLDIKPDNVMVEPDGRIVLIDFGAARQGLTGRTTQAFSPEYAPLEARAGDGASRVGPGSDIFELGMMMHEMLTGTLPPDAVQRAVDMTRGVEWSPVGLAEPWKTLLTAALKIELNDRPKDVSEWWNMPVAEAVPVVFTDPPVGGEDVRVNVTVSEGVVLVGGHVPVTPPHRDKMAVYVPPGVRDGQELRITGQGKAGQNGGKPGDLLITVRIAASAVRSASAAPSGTGRAALQTVTGISTLAETGPRPDAPPSAAPARVPPPPAPVAEYRIPLWKPAMVTLFFILLPVAGAVWWFAPDWVPKYAPGFVGSPLFPHVPKPKPRPPQKGKPQKPKTAKPKSAPQTGSIAPPPVTPSIRAAVAPVFVGSDMEGTWQGTLGGKSAELRIDSSSGKGFQGEITADSQTVRIAGSITNRGAVSLRETSVVTADGPLMEEEPVPSEDPGAIDPDAPEKPAETVVWHFGTGSGQLRNDGKRLTGYSVYRGKSYRFVLSK